ncbi:protein NO VEIN domain-containing protein [Phytohabitans suffuscus]|nr:DUF3883 domain-containing protein [Phytohabitans suffuscus]
MSEPTQAPHMSNRAIEDAAVAYLLEWEAARGRPSRDTHNTGAAADVANAHRTIEVKAYGGLARGQDLWLEPSQYTEGRDNPNFWLYVVENIRQGDPARFRLLEIDGETLRVMLVRAVERRCFTVPWPVATYDELIRDQYPA